MQSITLSGNLGKDSELRSTSNDQVLSFSVAVKQGFKQDAGSEWFRCSIWGKRAATLHQYLLKGVKVVVVGDLTIGEYNGKPQFDVNVREVELMSRAEQNGARQQTQPERSPFDDDSEVPF